jgi:hypothetical protein
MSKKDQLLDFFRQSEPQILESSEPSEHFAGLPPETSSIIAVPLLDQDGSYTVFCFTEDEEYIQGARVCQELE